MGNQTGLEFLQGTKNQFHNHWNLFITDRLTLKQLMLVTFAWVIQHESLYTEKPLPTEPLQYYGTTDADFKEVIKAWHLGCNSRELENKSNVRCFKKATRFFLESENDYDEGIALFEKHAEPEIVPF